MAEVARSTSNDDKLKISFVQVVLSGRETNFDSIHGSIPVLWRDIDRLGCLALNLCRKGSEPRDRRQICFESGLEGRSPLGRKNASMYAIPIPWPNEGDIVPLVTRPTLGLPGS